MDRPTASEADRRPLILISNDDGFDAPGIQALIEAVQPLGEIAVCAPQTEQSASSHALTLHRPLRMEQAGESRWRVDGTPSDCVHLALHCGVLNRSPALIVSGMNRGLNVGDDVTYSGTVAAALEGALAGIPSIAFSLQLDANGELDCASPVATAREIAQKVLSEGLPHGLLLNVNFPTAPYRGLRITRQGRRRFHAAVVERFDPAGRPYYWIAGEADTSAGAADDDYAAIVHGHVSVTPLYADLTHEPTLDRLRRWDLRPFAGT